MGEKRRALLLYPSQFHCVASHWHPIVVRTQLVKLYSALRERGIEARILDLELELGRPSSAAEIARFLEDAVRLVGDAPYDLIGISCYTSVNYLSTVAVARAFREVQPRAKIVVGGYHCLGKPADFLECDAIDWVVRGDGIQFVEAWASEAAIPRLACFEGSAPDPGRMRYDEYPYRYRSTASIANVQLSRGCPYPCRFCSEPYIGNSRFEPLEVDEAIARIDEIVTTLDPDKIVIEDLVFGFHAGWRYAFLEALRDRRYRQLFWVEMRSDTVTERTAELLAHMNFELTVGLESASPHTLALMRKARNPRRYIDAFLSTAAFVARWDVPTTFSIMLNYPGETFESFEETIANLELAQSSVVGPHFRFDCFEYSFYPGNHVYEELGELHRRIGTEIGDEHWYRRTDGRMLDMALCTVPSRALVERVGKEAMRSYFGDAVRRIQSRTAAAESLRCRTIRSWRFVAALQRRMPALRDESYYASGLEEGTRRRAEGIAALADAHRGLTNAWTTALERDEGKSWSTRQRAWEVALDAVVVRLASPHALEDPARVRHIANEVGVLEALPEELAARSGGCGGGERWADLI